MWLVEETSIHWNQDSLNRKMEQGEIGEDGINKQRSEFEKIGE